jgi:hypothetical protein
MLSTERLARGQRAPKIQHHRVPRSARQWLRVRWGGIVSVQMGGVGVWGSVFIESTKPRTAAPVFASVPSIFSEVRGIKDEREKY